MFNFLSSIHTMILMCCFLSFHCFFVFVFSTASVTNPSLAYQVRFHVATLNSKPLGSKASLPEKLQHYHTGFVKILDQLLVNPQFPNTPSHTCLLQRETAPSSTFPRSVGRIYLLQSFANYDSRELSLQALSSAKDVLDATLEALL